MDTLGVLGGLGGWEEISNLAQSPVETKRELPVSELGTSGEVTFLKGQRL